MTDPGNIDERLQFLLQSTESLHASVGRLFDITSEHTKQLKLWLDHEQQRQQRLDRTLRAALKAWLDNGDQGKD